MKWILSLLNSISSYSLKKKTPKNQIASFKYTHILEKMFVSKMHNSKNQVFEKEKTQY